MKINYEKLDYQENAVKAVINTLSNHDETATKLILNSDYLDNSVRETLLNNGQKYPGSGYLNPFPSLILKWKLEQVKQWFTYKPLWHCINAFMKTNL